ncbi:MAG: hypothetical protein WCT37_04400 [Patescibacteria group bacterium]|jgi:hypothetical protein
MNPLEIFNQIIKKLVFKPFSFWPKSEQAEIVREATVTIEQLKKVFEERQLVKNNAYKTLVQMAAATAGDFDEVVFVQGLDNLVEIYKLSSAYKQNKKLLDELGSRTKQAKKMILEYHMMLENLAEKGAEMTAEEKDQVDQDTIKKVGFFYILEYTLYVLHLLPQLNEKGRKKIFFEGLKTKEANLPPYTDFAESFRRDLCLKIFDESLRRNLLESFFKFEEIFVTADLGKICPAFKEFNLELLAEFKNKGLVNFEAAILTPFGKSIPLVELMEKVKAVAV